MLTIKEVQIEDYFDVALPLMRDNWDETGFDFDFNPSKQTYIALQKAGILFALAAFEDDQLIGYSTAIVAPHPFNPSIITSSTDALFLSKKHRVGFLALRLLRETEIVAKAKGATCIMWHTRAGTKLSEVLMRRGYKPADIVVYKEL